MRDLYQTYAENLTIAQGLVKPQLNRQMSEDEGLGIIQNNAVKLFQVHQDNDNILNEILFSKKAEELTADEAEHLGALADKLFHFNSSPDTGIAYRIHKLLYGYAQYHKDVDLTIKELYSLGITLLYLNVRNASLNINLFIDDIDWFFRTGASYIDQYDQLTNPKTRSYILRCMGNMKYGLKGYQHDDEGRICRIRESWEEYNACFNRAMDIFQSPKYRQMNPEIPWDNFVYTMHFDRTKFLSVLRSSDENPDIAREVLESAEHVFHHQEQIAKTNDTSVGTRTKYVYMAARFHAGLADIHELMDTLFDMSESASLEDFSGDNIWTMLSTPEYLAGYCSKYLPEEEKEAAMARIKLAADRQKKYIFMLPPSANYIQVARTLSMNATVISRGDAQRILNLILGCHPPTFVHSKMIALLARRMTEEMARKDPSLLEGTFGLEHIDASSDRLEQLLDQAYHGGLYHDLGKCMLLNYVGLYSRKLLDEEFACIKLHPGLGRNLLQLLQMDDVANIAYYHHRAYDGTGGYPRCDEKCPDRIRRIADIVTVADCLDAGTDNVGRSYAAAKTYEMLIEELRKWKGTRYAPEVVELFDDPDFYRDMKQFLTDNRRQVYLDIYYN